MKNLPIILFSFLALVSCVERPQHIQQSSQDVQKAYDLDGKVIHIRGCDYVTLYTGSHVLVHAGDCINPIHNCPCDTLPDTTQR